MDDGGRSLPSTIFLCDPLARSPPAPPSPARSTALSPVAAGDPRSTSANPTVPPFPPSRPSSSTRMKRESASRTSRASSGPVTALTWCTNWGRLGPKSSVTALHGRFCRGSPSGAPACRDHCQGRLQKKIEPCESLPTREGMDTIFIAPRSTAAIKRVSIPSPVGSDSNGSICFANALDHDHGRLARHLVILEQNLPWRAVTEDFGPNHVV